MAKANNTKKLIETTEQQMTYLDWQKKMLESIVADLEETEVIEDE